ncbi:VPS4-associated protein 1 [Sporodiniella umbellata]|nr:VPS4-associated protein 1 [Sporodiniella umbellata]
MASFQNSYVARLVTSDRPCFVCNKFTNVVLTLADDSNNDWFYVCRSHLGDFNFCSKLGRSPKSKVERKESIKVARESDSMSDLVSTIGSAWQSWRSKGTEEKKKEEDEKKDKEEKDKDKEKEEKEKEDKEKKDKEKKDKREPTIEAPTVQQQPIRFVLQKDYFYLRQREQAKRRQKREAGERIKSLEFPEVPKQAPQ